MYVRALLETWSSLYVWTELEHRIYQTFCWWCSTCSLLNSFASMFNRVSSYRKAVCRSLNSLSILHFCSHKYMYHYILSCVIIIRQSGNHMQKKPGDKQHQISRGDNYKKFYLLLLFDHRGLGFGVALTSHIHQWLAGTLLKNGNTFWQVFISV